MATFQTLPSSSWADDDDDFDVPVPAAAPAAAPARVASPRNASPRHAAPSHDSGHRHHDDHEASGHGGRGRRNSGDNFEKREKLPVPDYGPFKSYVGNLPYSVHEDDLVELFVGCNIKDIRLPQDHNTGRPKGFAYVEFGDRESLVRALEFDGEALNQRAIRVDVAGEKKGGRNDGGFFQKRDGGDRYQRDGGDRYQREDRYQRDDRGPQRSDGNWGADRRPQREERRAPREEGEHQQQSNAPAERPKLALKPRTKSKEELVEGGARSANVFGDAKPRDERSVKPAADRPAPVARQDSADRAQRDQGGRGGRGGRGDKGGRGGEPAKPSRSDGDWGRGSAAAAGASAVEKKAKKAPKAEKDLTKAAVYKPAAVSTKVVNAFSLLNDSDSD